MPDTFDIAFSIGVIHHLKDPKIAVENLFNSLKEGGTLIIWVYAKEGNENYIRLLKTLRFLPKTSSNNSKIYSKSIIHYFMGYFKNYREQ